MKLFYATLGAETNTFSPIPTGLNAWRSGTLVRSGDTDGPAARRVRGSLRPLLEWGAARDWEIVVGLQANAAPGGTIPRPVYEELRGELIKDLWAAMPVDGVVLYPHGAMVAEGYDDCAGDLLRRAREVVGPRVPIGAALDPHCHLTEDMLTRATVLVGFKEYPHLDAIDRILETFELVARAAEGEIRPTMARFECRMIETFPTTSEPMRTVVREMKELERESGVLNVWLCHGFPYGDVPAIGAQAVAITDNDQALAAQLAEKIGRRFFAIRAQLRQTLLTIDQSLSRALSAERGPITIADAADNPGGGAPGDSTFFLRTLIDRAIENAALGPLYDPETVAICHDAGLGTKLALRIGGKLGPASGDPVDAVCTVIGLADEVIQNYAGLRLSLGPCAAVKLDMRGDGPTAGTGIEVVLSAKREQARTPELFTALNIDPSAKKILVVKSTHHFTAGFTAISAEILHSAGAGALAGDVTTIPYTRVATHRYWPFVDDPFAGELN